MCNKTIDGHRSMPKETNPNYGNGEKLKATYRNDPQLKERTKRVGTDNGRAQKCVLIFPNGEKLVFDTIKDLCIYLIDNGFSKSTIPHLQSAISICVKKHKPYLGFTFEYL